MQIVYTRLGHAKVNGACEWESIVARGRLLSYINPPCNYIGNVFVLLGGESVQRVAKSDCHDLVIINTRTKRNKKKTKRIMTFICGS